MPKTPANKLLERLALKALYALSFTTLVFPHKTPPELALIAGIFFAISLIPEPRHDPMPKKLDIGLTITLLVIGTTFTIKAVHEQHNVFIILGAYLFICFLCIRSLCKPMHR